MEEIVSVIDKGNLFQLNVQSTEHGDATRWVPKDPLNQDYQRIVQWQFTGGTVTPYAPSPSLSASAKRAIQYRDHLDPILISHYGYQLERAAETDPNKQAALDQKIVQTRNEYINKKAQIRAANPG